MPNIPVQVASVMRSQGSPVPVSLLEMQLISGARLYFADCDISVVSLLTTFDQTGQTIMPFKSWLLDPPSFKFAGTTVTQTANATIQNTSGDTVNRINSLLFSKQDLWGALFIYRLWQAAAEYAFITQIGIVNDAEVDGTDMQLTLSTWLNFSQIPAPDCQINNNCQNVFQSQQCGSTSTVNCLNSYGNCSQINRFKGLITQWNTGVYNVAYNSGLAQPVPILNLNQRIPG